MDPLALLAQAALSVPDHPPFVIVDTGPSVIATWGTVALGVFNLVVLFGTLKILSKQHAAMQATVKAAERSAAASEAAVGVAQSAHVDQARAYVTLGVDLAESGFSSDGFSVFLQITNVGLTPALEVSTDGDLHFLGSDDELSNHPTLQPRSKGSIGRAVLTPNTPINQQYWLSPEVSGDLRSGAKHLRNLHLFVRVAVEYEDCLERRHRRTDFAAKLVLDREGNVIKAVVPSKGNALT